MCTYRMRHAMHGNKKKEKVMSIFLLFLSLSFQQHFSVHARSYQIPAPKARGGAHDLFKQRTVLRHYPERDG